MSSQVFGKNTSLIPLPVVLKTTDLPSEAFAEKTEATLYFVRTAVCLYDYYNIACWIRVGRQ